jgi:probable rRNA maturation factor
MPPDGQRRPRLRVLIADERGRAVRRRALATWLARVSPARARGVVSIALVSDRRMRALNREYRGQDMVTDVLSFPALSARPSALRRSSHQLPATSHRLLGDLAIASGVARRQARDGGHSLLTELKVLALHGLLHLLGYDHERDGGRMQRIEERLRRRGGLRTGLIERAHGSLRTRR